MVPFLWPTSIVDNEDGTSSIRLNIPNVNHNTVDVKKTYEISDNFLGNPLNKNSTHARSFGQDSELFVIKWKKVCFICFEVFLTQRFFSFNEPWVNCSNVEKISHYVGVTNNE